MTTFETLDGSWLGSSKELAKKASKRDKVTYQRNIGDLWSEEQLETLGFKVKTPEPEPIPEPIPEPTVEELKASHISLIKMEAGFRITQVIPEWKQRNLTAQATQLAEKGRNSWSPQELSEWEAGVVLWNTVKDIRDKSDVLEASLDTMTLEELKSFDSHTSEVWA